METFELDPAAMAAYTAIAEAVSQQLSSASAVASRAIDPTQLTTDLGLIGAEFTSRFSTAVNEHAQALSTAGQLVSAYGQVLHGYSGNAQDVDTDTAQVITRAQENLA